MYKSLRVLALLLVFGLSSTAVWGQNLTTAAMNGTVTSTDGTPLIGATVKAVHQPTGALYGAYTNEAGRFNLVNLRVGGPYTVTVNYVGYQTYSQEGISLNLQQNLTLNVRLTEEGVNVEGVTITADFDPIMNGQRTGAATNVNKEQLLTLPTLDRSLSDFTRLTPQASQNGSGFGGRNGQFNNYSIDGAYVNNVFGLGTDPLPGGNSNTQPISLDALEQVQVNIAPYDVRLSSFTGASINAVTRSGTNEVSGSVYWFTYNQNFAGDRVRDVELNRDPFTYNQFGFRIGGPIIKDKLFFFVNAELNQEEQPYTTFVPYDNPSQAGTGNVAYVSRDSLNQLSSFLSSRFGYDTGATSYNDETKGEKVFFRLDWNASGNHKVSFRGSYVRADDFRTASTSSSNASPVFNRNFSRRNTESSIPFYNANYVYETEILSGSLEINSVFGTNIANQFLATATLIDEAQVPPDMSMFPMVEIVNVDATNPNTGAYATIFGTEQFRGDNAIVQDQIVIQNNLNIYSGKHNILIGAALELYFVDNRFLRQRFGRYTYPSFEAFFNDVNGVNDGTNPYYVRGFDFDGRSSNAKVDLGQFGIYLQDEYSLNKNVRITAGVRLDMPFYSTSPVANTAVDGAFGINTGSLPGTNMLISPRVGVNWDVYGDQSLQVRGGTGLFAGRYPFVWMANNVSGTGSNSGFYFNWSGNNGDFTTDIDDPINFSPDIDGQSSLYSTAPGSGTTSVNFADQDFKLPQIWRTSIGADYQLDNGIILTADVAFSKDVNAIYHQNLNYQPFDDVISIGSGQAVFGISDAERRANTDFFEVVQLTNTDKGYSWFATFQVQKYFGQKGYISAAYNYSAAYDASSNQGSQAFSVFQANPIVGDPNVPFLQPSAYFAGHRFMLNGSYTFEYGGRFATTIAAFYEIGTGPRYDFTYNGDINNDGIFGNDLMYIPRNAGEVNLSNPADYALLDAFIENNDYLSDNRGSFAEREGATVEAVGRLDLRILQDIKFQVAGKENRFQITLDIINAGNLINKDWGVTRFVRESQPLSVNTALSTPTNKVFDVDVNPNNLDATDYSLGIGSTYRLQLGLRYIFN